MTTRSKLLSLLAALLLIGVPASADLRDELEPAHAELVEHLLVRLHPGSTVEWMPTLAVVQGSNKQPVRLGGIDVRKDDGGGYTGVVTFELTANRAAIFEAIEAWEAVPSRSTAQIVAFKAGAQRDITETRLATLSDPAAAIENVDKAELTNFTYHLPWPDAYITYTGVYATANFHGDIQWEEKIVFDPAPTVTGRAPSVVSRVDKTSRLRRSDAVTVDVVDENTMSFASTATGHVISNCADPCLPDGRVLLALWWTSSTITAP